MFRLLRSDRVASHNSRFIEDLESRTLLSSAAPPAAFIAQPLSAIAVPLQANANAPVPVLTATPTSGNAPLTVSFSATQSTSPLGLPLHFAWRFGDNTTPQRGATVQHTYATTGLFNATLIAIDSAGRRALTRTQIAVGVTSPVITIVTPTAGSTYTPGSTIRLLGNATDSRGIALPNRTFTWTAELHSGNTVTPIIHPIVGARAASFVVPAIPPSADQFLRVRLTVASKSGLVGSQFVDLVPATATLTLQSNIGAVRIKVDNSFQQTPVSIPAAVGSTVRVTAPRRVAVDGVPYVFSRWSDRGRPAHNVLIPVGGRTLLAIYRPAPL